MIEFFTIIKETPEIMLKNPTFKRVMDSTHNLLGGTVDITPTATVTASATQQNIQELECIFWEDPARLAILDEMAKTKIERDQLLNSMCEPPSFSIGLTQMDMNDNLGLDSLDVNTLFDDQVDKNANPTPIDTHDEVINEVEKNENPTPIDTRDEVVNEAEKNVNPTRTDAYDNHAEKNADATPTHEDDSELDAARNEELRTKNKLDKGKAKVTKNKSFQVQLYYFFKLCSNNQVTIETVVKRSTHEQKKPDTLLSPYIVRVINSGFSCISGLN